jgi:hypothetical protein
MKDSEGEGSQKAGKSEGGKVTGTQSRCAHPNLKVYFSVEIPHVSGDEKVSEKCVYI